MSRFSACPRYSSSGSIRVADPSFIVNDCPPVPATPDAARHSSLPSYTASVHGAETPCERSDGYPTAATYYARSPGQDSAVGKDELPSYAKFAERSRVERCFWYGFLLAPIWLWGFLHYFAWFSQPSPHARKTSAKPDVEAGAIDMADLFSTATPTLIVTSHSSAAPGYRATEQTPVGVATTDSPVGPIVLESNRPGVEGVWRTHERKWALKCGAALAVWWFVLVLIIVTGLMLSGKQ